MLCPSCKHNARQLFKCDVCGEVRCGQTSCTGNKGGGSGYAGAGRPCRHCGRGKYLPYVPPNQPKPLKFDF